jgi:hypothetical protein
MKTDPANINPADARDALGAVAEIRASMKPALRVAVREAKHRLTLARLDLDAAIDAHMRALRSESRARPVWISPDSDQTSDALDAAFRAFRSRATTLDYLATEYRRASL